MFDSIYILDAYEDIVNTIIDYRLPSKDQLELVLELLRDIGQLSDRDIEQVRAIVELKRLLPDKLVDKR